MLDKSEQMTYHKNRKGHAGRRSAPTLVERITVVIAVRGGYFFLLQTLSTSLIMSIFVAKSFTKTLTNFLINGIIYMSIIFLEDINEREI